MDRTEPHNPAAGAAAPAPSPDAAQRPGHRHGERTPVSDIILATARDWPLPRITLGELIAAFGMRSYGLLIVLFAIPNLLPIYIPGLSPIFGIPLAIIALQLALGYPMPKLPGILTRRSLKREDLQNIAVSAQPWLRRIEWFLKPRPSALTRRGGERILGAYMFCLALLVIVPLPFTNGPPSFACAIIAIGLIEEDTLTILAGIVVGIFATVLALSIMGGFWWLLVAGWQFIFGG
ncbi:MAG: exopolysaccharide biosynthesis protein [Acetobacteraceae bacterium]